MRLALSLVFLVCIYPWSISQAITLMELRFDELVHRSEAALTARVVGLRTVERGRMLHTEVTLAVEQQIFGSLADTLTIRVAGGRNLYTEVRVSGMPSFESGQRYLLFLRPGFDAVADPITGVGQGFFRIAVDADSGRDTLLNARGDIVTGVHDRHLSVRRNPARSRQSVMHLEEAPRPDSGVVPYHGSSTAALSYWQSSTPALSVDDFVAEILRQRAIP